MMDAVTAIIVLIAQIIVLQIVEKIASFVDAIAKLVTVVMK